jgi:Zn-dependent peptidase ImmA (M78 family)/transcriptional regulator with XRE-family HTH domain
MRTTNKAYLNGKMIGWARVQNGVKYDQIEKSLALTKDQIVDWENGRTLPTFNQAIDLADALRIPFGYLFLTNPPNVKIPLPDLRTRKSSGRRTPSGNFVELLDQALTKQEWYREYLLEQGRAPLPFVSKFTLRDSITSVAADIRTTLGIDAMLRRNAGTLDKYLSMLSMNAEAAGVVVLRSSVVGSNNNRRLDADEFQGFAIADDIAPFVFVNADDFKAARIFTLIHELAHIWVGKSGVSNTDEEGITTTHEQAVEIFCNRVAVETLVPQAEFLRAWVGGTPDHLITKLTNEFRVSTFVIIRRAHELNLITTPAFRALLDAARKHITKSKGKGGRNDYWQTVITRHSQTFTGAVMSDVRQGRTLWRDAANLLGVQVPTLMNFMDRPG